MPFPEYFVAFDDHKGKSLAAFSAVLHALPAKCVGTVQLHELCSMTKYPNGVYLFFKDKALWYVGKTTSRSFIERVPSHFDQREHVWFNTLPKKVMSICKIGVYPEALAIGLNLRLALVGVKGKKTAGELEKVLRSYLQPMLNARKKGNITGEELISSYEFPE